MHTALYDGICYHDVKRAFYLVCRGFEKVDIIYKVPILAKLALPHNYSVSIPVAAFYFAVNSIVCMPSVDQAIKVPG